MNFATEASASQISQKWAGCFNASGEAKDGHTPQEVEQAIYDEIEKLKGEPVPAQVSKVGTCLARSVWATRLRRFGPYLNTGLSIDPILDLQE